MKSIASLSLLVLAPIVLGHGDHHTGPAPGETIQQYAQRHMSSEHHIDSFDTRSFHKLHDLNGDGAWDREEIEAVYGVHHIYSKKHTKARRTFESIPPSLTSRAIQDDEEHKKKADFIVDAVLQRLDLNKDGFIDPSELEKVGLDGLPNFDSLGAEGHHYDVESEFFLHHEEQFHSTPETQTDESYNHPEDLEHFAHHEAIEKQEAEREAKYQGITVEEVLKEQEKAQAEAAAQAEKAKQEEHPGIPKVTRVSPPEKQDPSVRFKTAFQEGQQKGDWGTGEAGFKPPTAPGDKMRKNLPYKYKFRRNWGDF